MTNVVQTVQVKNKSLLMTKGIGYWSWIAKKNYCLKLYTGREWKLYTIPAKCLILLLENLSDWNALQSKLL